MLFYGADVTREQLEQRTVSTKLTVDLVNVEIYHKIFGFLIICKFSNN